jgi:hypothetical protein
LPLAEEPADILVTLANKQLLPVPAEQMLEVALPAAMAAAALRIAAAAAAAAAGIRIAILGTAALAAQA